MQKKVLTISELATALGMSTGAIRLRIHRGQLDTLPPSILCGSKRLFPIDAFEQWLTPSIDATSQKKQGRPTKKEEIKKREANA